MCRQLCFILLLKSVVLLNNAAVLQGLRAASASSTFMSPLPLCQGSGRVKNKQTETTLHQNISRHETILVINVTVIILLYHKITVRLP